MESKNENKENVTKEKKFKINLKKIKHKKTLIVCCIIIVVVLFQILKPKEVVEEKIETENIEKRTISTSIAATGVIKTSNTKNIVSTLTGSKINTINVKEGQKVSVGDVICTFDTSTIQDSLNTAQSSLNLSKAQGSLGIQSAQRSLKDAITNKDTQVNATQSDVNTALSAYQEAEKNLENAKTALNTNKSNLEKYNQTYKNAENNFNKIKAEYNSKEMKYNELTNSYTAAQALMTTLTPGSAEYNEAQTKLIDLEQKMNTAKSDYLSYKSTYDSTVATFTPIQTNYQNLVQSVASSEASVNALQETVNTLKQAYDKTVQVHNSTVSTADSTIASMQENLTNSELSASLSTKTQEAQIKAYKNQLEDGVIKSTVNGVVTSVSAKAGDIYAGTPIAVIEGSEDFIIETEIDEYDIADIDEGMEVLIKTDSTRDEELKGRVVYTAPSATENQTASMVGATASTSATYKVQIQLDSVNDRLRLGMNAKLSILTAKKENVWTVPYNAIYERDDGTKYIEILKNNESQEKEELDVTTGFESSYYVEIISDKLTDGMKVVLPKVEADNSIEALIEMMGSDAGV